MTAPESTERRLGEIEALHRGCFICQSIRGGAKAKCPVALLQAENARLRGALEETRHELEMQALNFDDWARRSDIGDKWRSSYRYMAKSIRKRLKALAGPGGGEG